jgi:hypothetical protein
MNQACSNLQGIHRVGSGLLLQQPMNVCGMNQVADTVPTVLCVLVSTCIHRRSIWSLLRVQL